MELSEYSLKDLLLSALRAELDSRGYYEGVAERVKNFLLKDRLKFLAGEEEKHARYFRKILEERYPGEDITPPEKTPVPLPELKLGDESIPLSEVLWQAMQAEKAAEEFYTGLAARFPADSQERKMVLYIAAMEKGHYRLLDQEREAALQFEDMDTVWAMTHIGP